MTRLPLAENIRLCNHHLRAIRCNTTVTGGGSQIRLPRTQHHFCLLYRSHRGCLRGHRSVSALIASSSRGSTPAAGTSEGNWSFWDDDSYDLVDYVIASANEEQDAALEARGEPEGAGLTGMVASASRRTASAASGTAGLLWDAGTKVGTAAGRTPVGRAAARAHSNWEEAAAELPKGIWHRALWFWNRPTFQRLRFTISMANLSVRLPAILALVGTQIGLLATQVSLPMLAPLLLGTGMMIRSIKANASMIFPRIGLMVVLLWMLWFMNTIIHNTVMYLRRQGAIDQRVAGMALNGTELCALLAAVVIFLSMLGLNVSSLLIPIGIAGAIAAKDLSHNFLAGFFLFAVQPFKLGDRVGVPYSNPGASPAGTSSQDGWFEGVCEKVDLRYTTIQRGRQRLMVPNSSFITREFMVIDDPSLASEHWPSHMRVSTDPRETNAQAPPASSEWVRHAVLEEQPFHSSQEAPSTAESTDDELRRDSHVSGSSAVSPLTSSEERTQEQETKRIDQKQQQQQQQQQLQPQQTQRIKSRLKPEEDDLHESSQVKAEEQIQQDKNQKAAELQQQHEQQLQDSKRQQEQQFPHDLEPFSVLD